jgi:hypothetical protein
MEVEEAALLVPVTVLPLEDVDANCSSFFSFCLGSILCECSTDVLCCHILHAFFVLLASLGSDLAFLFLLPFCLLLFVIPAVRPTPAP